MLVLVVLAGWLRYTGVVTLPWRPLAAVLGGMAAINLLLGLRLRRDWPVSGAEFLANLLMDVVFLTAVLYLTGGSTNPLVSYFLIPLIISAAVLRPVYTWTIAALAMAGYTFLMFRNVPLAIFSAGGHESMMTAHFTGMWINFVFSAVLIAWFVVRMAATMREQERAIADAREAGLRDEQIISVAGIAAGTAHELRTPLATLTVLTEELRSQNPGLQEELETMQQQLERCDEILRELVSATADSSRKRRETLGGLIRELLERWRLVRPEVALESRLDPEVADRELITDQSLQLALLSFLHNAADVSPEGVRLEVSGDGGYALVVIEDRGPGIPADVVDRLGRQYVSRKEGGLGLGVLLSSASIERLEGSVALLPRPGGGTRLEIRLPLAAP